MLIGETPGKLEDRLKIISGPCWRITKKCYQQSTLKEEVYLT